MVVAVVAVVVVGDVSAARQVVEARSGGCCERSCGSISRGRSNGRCGTCSLNLWGMQYKQQKQETKHMNP